MNVLTTPLPGLLRLVPTQYADDRGRFIVTFDQRRFDEAIGHPVSFVQDNESTSGRGVLRGLHFQLPPHAQGKLVHVVRGRVLDVCVDLRTESPTHGRHYKLVLDTITKEQLWIPPGFAHGFLALEEDTIFSYKCTGYYAPSAERSIRWNDPDLAIDWECSAPLISPKDAAAAAFADGPWWPAA
jgi:dTDP-4-dehydrorhamnose 3,5-epimerase